MGTPCHAKGTARRYLFRSRQGPIHGIDHTPRPPTSDLGAYHQTERPMKKENKDDLYTVLTFFVGLVIICTAPFAWEQVYTLLKPVIYRPDQDAAGLALSAVLAAAAQMLVGVGVCGAAAED